jgi:translation initiation factor IF-2
LRLHELAKELGLASKELLAQVREIGLNIKSHSSNLEAGEESLLRYAMKEVVEERRREEEEKAAKKAARKTGKKKKPEKQAESVPAVEGEPETAVAEDGTAGEDDAVAVIDTVDVAEGSDDVVAGETAVVVQDEGTPDSVAGEEGAAATTGAEDKKEETPAAADSVVATADGEDGAEGVEEAEKEEAGEEKKKEEPVDSQAKPHLKKLRKVTRKRPSATILGRIELPSATLEAHKRAKERKKEDPGLRRRSAEKKTDTDQPEAPSDRFRKVVVGRPADVPDDKVRRTIKPKQSPVEYSGTEDDPLLRGVRISHWDKHYKRRRPVFRHGRGQRKARRIAPTPDWKVEVAVPVSLKELSQLMGVKAQDIMMALMKRGTMVHINSSLDEETVLNIAVDFNREIDVTLKKDKEEIFLEEVQVGDEIETGEIESRPPIVTFLGHVDHGKTSLLDAIRKTDVVSTEEGGITQHISAYRVKTASGHSVTFLDTPGHKAFTEMRARGANATDIVVLVVAGDDGVMPQTEEAIQHALAAKVPLVVAINKMDKPDANAQRVKQQLSGLGIMTEDWGGEVGCIEVSAITGMGLDELLERLILESEILEVNASNELPARGVVIESRKDVEIGNVVTLLITDGTLRLRDNLLGGEAFCRVRGITDDKGRKLEEAGPSMPVNVMGFESLPDSGETFNCIESLERAREISEIRRSKSREKRLAPDKKTVTLENLFESLEAGKVTEINVVVKSDVKGSMEVLRKSFEEMAHEEVKIKIIRDGVGAITEEDILLAIASEAIVLGFRVTTDTKSRKLIEENKVEVKSYRVIYELLEDLRAAMEGSLTPFQREKVTGHLDIRQIFKSSRIGNIAGCFVTDGVVKRTSKVRLLRDSVYVYEGDLGTLKRFKDDVREVREGFECGAKIEGYDDVKVGDVIEAFEFHEEKRTLGQAPEKSSKKTEAAGPKG